MPNTMTMQNTTAYVNSRVFAIGSLSISASSYGEAEAENVMIRFYTKRGTENVLNMCKQDFNSFCSLIDEVRAKALSEISA